MIQHKQGNIFDSECKVLVNPVNCKGISGKGLAKAFKQHFPIEQYAYEGFCRQKELKPGDVFIITMDHEKHVIRNNDKIIAYFATKDDWRHPSKYEYIVDGLSKLRENLYLYDLKSVAIPSLGCGLGGLYWPAVKACIHYAFVGGDDLVIEVYEPYKEI